MGPTWKISFYITIIFWMLVSSLEEVSHDQLNVSSAVVAEWLRRLTRNQLRSPCTGSNPVNCDFFFSHLLRARSYRHLRCVISISKKGQWLCFIELVTGRWMARTVGPWMDAYMHGWLDEWITGWKDGWMDGRMDGPFNKHAMSHLKSQKTMPPPVGLEPTIPGLGGQCLIH